MYELQETACSTRQVTVATYSTNKVRRFLSSGVSAASTTARGRSCEDLGVYIFEKFAGVELVASNALDGFGAAETDLVFTNDSNRSGLYFLEPVLIVECKNYSTFNVSSADVTYFATRLRQKGARSGIILTTTSLSGSDGFAGHHAIEAALIDGVTILIINRALIDALTDTSSLLGELNRQIIQLRVSGMLTLP